MIRWLLRTLGTGGKEYGYYGREGSANRGPGAMGWLLSSVKMKKKKVANEFGRKVVTACQNGLPTES